MALTIDQTTLLDANLIDLAGEVDDDMAVYVRESIPRLMSRGSPEITVLISSTGGNLLNGLFVIDSLLAYPGKTTGKAIGLCQSMAAVILQACTHRQACAQTRLLIHDPVFWKISFNTVVSQTKRSRAMAEQDRYSQRTYQLLCRRTCRSMREVRALCRREKELFPEEALKFGLIDEIIGA